MSVFEYDDDFGWFFAEVKLPGNVGVSVANPIEVLALTSEWAGESDGRTEDLTAEQQAAFQSLSEQLPDIVARAIGLLAVEIPEMYGLDQMPDEFPEGSDEQLAYVREDLCLTGISLLTTITNGRGDFAIDFESEEIDPEHGFSVLIQDGQPSSFAGAGEQGGF